MEFDLSQQKIIPVNLEEEMKKSFISYAMATIINRALPDVRDGLKPVHRRILYAMHELGVTPDKPHRKSVRIVGDVLGKYHPHGDSSVYDAMVRMAQDFSIRYMLVDGHGNFGSVDGDGAAAMRYTEARMAKITLEMLRDIEKDTIDFEPNFDGTHMQPTVLPSRFPNLLVNGSGGIAVGMATNIPPHNLGEVIDGVLALIEDPDIPVEGLMEFIPGPDFPTGATILGRGDIYEAYRTGRGRVIMRGKADFEEMGNSRTRIVIHAIPYQVNKAKLVEKIAELVQSKRLEGVSDIRDESDRTGMRIVVELKRDVNPEIVLNTLYKHTQMQETFGVNMLALVDGEPKVLPLKQILYHYLEHQKDVVTRRTKYELERALARIHIVEGLLKALDIIDAIIALIRGSKNGPEAKEGLMTQFDFSERQAQAILDMRLQRLTGLEYDRLMEEFGELTNRIAYYRQILGDETMLLNIIKEELGELRRKYADGRRTEILDSVSDIDMEELIQEEDMVITMTHTGYIKRLTIDTYRTQRRGGVGIMGQSTRQEDFVENILVTTTHQWLLFFTSTGRIHRIKCYQIPAAGRTAHGIPVVNLLQLDEGERVRAIIPLDDRNDLSGQYLTLCTLGGVIKKTPLTEYQNLKNVGLKALKLNEDDEVIGAQLTNGDGEVLVATRSGMVIRFHESDVRPMHRVSAGVRAIKLREDDRVVDMVVAAEGTNLMVVTETGYGKRTDLDQYRLQNRGGYGIKTLKVTEKTGLVVALRCVSDDKDVLLISTDGTIIRLPAVQISTIGRATQGIRLMRLREGDQVVAVAVIDSEPDEPTNSLPESLDEEDVLEELTPEESGELAPDEPEEQLDEEEDLEELDTVSDDDEVTEETTADDDDDPEEISDHDDDDIDV